MRAIRMRATRRPTIQYRDLRKSTRLSRFFLKRQPQGGSLTVSEDDDLDPFSRLVRLQNRVDVVHGGDVASFD